MQNQIIQQTQNTISYKLNNNNIIPLIGFGTWKLQKQKCQQVIYNAIKMGYRHIDCAAVYGNQQYVGKGIKKALDQKIVQRKDLFITTKLWNTYHRPQYVKSACLRSLKDLQIQYADLYLMHYPISIKYQSPQIQYPKIWLDKGSKEIIEDQVPIIDTWKAMEQLVKEGLVKSIGVSNFNISILRDLWNSSSIKPTVLQNQLHPYMTCKILKRFCDSKHIHLTSYSTLAGSSYVQMSLAEQKDKIVNNQVLQQLSKNKNKTVTQLVLRWAIQQGISVLPKSSNLSHMKENRQLLGWKLSQQEMKIIDNLNRDQRFLDVMVLVQKTYGYFYPLWQ